MPEHLSKLFIKNSFTKETLIENIKKQNTDKKYTQYFEREKKKKSNR